MNKLHLILSPDLKSLQQAFVTTWKDVLQARLQDEATGAQRSPFRKEWVLVERSLSENMLKRVLADPDYGGMISSGWHFGTLDRWVDDLIRILSLYLRGQQKRAQPGEVDVAKNISAQLALHLKTNNTYKQQGISWVLMKFFDRWLLGDEGQVSEKSMDKKVPWEGLSDEKKKRLRPLLAYLRQFPNQEAIFTFAQSLAYTYDQYLLYRSDWLSAWESWEEDRAPKPPAQWKGVEEETFLWQSALWSEVRKECALEHPVASVVSLLVSLNNTLEGEARIFLQSFFPKLFIFDLPTLPPLYGKLIKILTEFTDIYYFKWDPLLTGKDERARRAIEALLSTAGDSEQWQRGSPPLSKRRYDYFGSLGKEFSAALSWKLIAGEKEALRGKKPRALHLFQQILKSEPKPEEEGQVSFQPSDSSAAVVELFLQALRNEREEEAAGLCSPSLAFTATRTRGEEVEWVYEKIITLFREDETLLPSDVCILSPNIAGYAAPLETTFERGGYLRLDITPFWKRSQEFSVMRSTWSSFFKLLLRSSLPYEELMMLARIITPEEVATDTAQALWKRLMSTFFTISDPLQGKERKEEREISLKMLLASLERLVGRAPVAELDDREKTILGHWVMRLRKWSEFRGRLVRPALSSPVREETAAVWREELRSVMGEIHFDGTNDEAIAEAIEKFFTAFLAPQYGLEEECYTFETLLQRLQSFLHSIFDNSQGEALFLTGGVIATSLQRARSLTPRILFIMGMDGSSFPRDPGHRDFDLTFYEPRLSDHDIHVRATDEWHWLECLHKAGDALFITMSHHSIPATHVSVEDITNAYFRYGTSSLKPLLYALLRQRMELSSAVRDEERPVHGWLAGWLSEMVTLPGGSSGLFAPLSLRTNISFDAPSSPEEGFPRSAAAPWSDRLHRLISLPERVSPVAAYESEASVGTEQVVTAEKKFSFLYAYETEAGGVLGLDRLKKFLKKPLSTYLQNHFFLDEATLKQFGSVFFAKDWDDPYGARLTVRRREALLKATEFIFTEGVSPEEAWLVAKDSLERTETVPGGLFVRALDEGNTATCDFLGIFDPAEAKTGRLESSAEGFSLLKGEHPSRKYLEALLELRVQAMQRSCYNDMKSFFMAGEDNSGEAFDLIKVGQSGILPWHSLASQARAGEAFGGVHALKFDLSELVTTGGRHKAILYHLNMGKLSFSSLLSWLLDSLCFFLASHETSKSTLHVPHVLSTLYQYHGKNIKKSLYGECDKVQWNPEVFTFHELEELFASFVQWLVAATVSPFPIILSDGFGLMKVLSKRKEKSGQEGGGGEKKREADAVFIFEKLLQQMAEDWEEVYDKSGGFGKPYFDDAKEVTTFFYRDLSLLGAEEAGSAKKTMSGLRDELPRGVWEHWGPHLASCREFADLLARMLPGLSVSKLDLT